MIPENLIRIAANWLANHQRELNDDELNVPIAFRRESYYRRAFAELSRVAELPSNEHRKVGMSVPCGGIRGDGLSPLATVKVFATHVLGYLPGDEQPSFIYPPDLAEGLRKKWADRQAQLN